jgi:hypothetical protein
VTLWNFIIGFVEPSAGIKLTAWVPTITPSFSPTEPLPEDAEYKAMLRAMNYLHSGSGLFITSNNTMNVTNACPAPFAPSPSDIKCFLEGLDSDIQWNGTRLIQPSGLSEKALLLC